jgi:hypothetical protein
MPNAKPKPVVRNLTFSEKQPKNKVRFDAEDGSEYLTREEFDALGQPQSITVTVAAA